MPVALDPEQARIANLRRKAVMAERHARDRDPLTGKSRLAQRAGRLGGLKRIESEVSPAAWGLRMALKRWHGVPMPGNPKPEPLPRRTRQEPISGRVYKLQASDARHLACYVGQTHGSLQRRLQQHRNSFKMGTWIREVEARGAQVEIIELETNPAQGLNAAEHHWEVQLRQEGHPLLNHEKKERVV